MKCVITNKGLNLLHTTPADGTARFWIGYYGLAFVPSENRKTGAVDEVTQDMRVLTKTGDHIYNLWQGAMPCSGYAEQSGAADLYGLSLYTSNVMSRFRYVMDEDGNNNLVMWKGTTDSSVTDMVGATVYRGVNLDDPERQNSEMPVPAPLFYMGESHNYEDKLTVDQMKAVIVGNESAPYDYPTLEIDDGIIPLVSTDTRGYNKSKAGMEGPSVDNGFDDIGAIPTQSKYDWTGASDTYHQLGDGEQPGEEEKQITNDRNRMCKQFWKFQSISNYNRFHAPASAEGFQVDYEPSCRNMSKVTKLFPISQYKVINAAENASSMENNTTQKLASALQFTIEMNIADIKNTTALRTITYSAPDPSTVIDADGNDVYTTRKSSFKFNRIGLYAVPMSVHKFYDQFNSSEGKNNCQDYKVQFEITGDAEPILFAVIDLDQTINMREGEVDKFKFPITLNVANDDGGEGSVIRDSAIFYNLYEDDSINWYKNQLIATASLSDAVVDQSIEMNYLRRMVAENVGGNGVCDSRVDLNDLYASKNHTHDYLRNLVDSMGAGMGVRGVETVEEGTEIKSYAFDDYTPDMTDLDGEYKDCGYEESVDGSTRTYFVVTGF